MSNDFLPMQLPIEESIEFIDAHYPRIMKLEFNKKHAVFFWNIVLRDELLNEYSFHVSRTEENEDLYSFHIGSDNPLFFFSLGRATGKHL